MRCVLGSLVLAFAPLAAVKGQVPEFAVKLICNVPDRPALAPGRYFTAINVHNPAPQAVKLQFKIAQTLPGVTPGAVSQFFPAVLRADQALEIDCTDVARHLDLGGKFVKGFVVIQNLSGSDLDVVGVYTVAQATDGRVVALEIERVPVRRTYK